ncbi:MAG TPA: response regulator transcription factor [Thermomicrobiales bacterium]|nr:response regulator transcription factor [Thermomicrobiales bacterium]
MRILLIEDDTRLASVIARLLRQERFEVDLAADGATGRDLALTGVYDALIIDRMLPELDGLELLRALRAEQIATPALMLTARSRPPERVEGLDAGADDYLGKPVDVDEMLARLRALLRRGERPLLEPTITIGAVTIDFASHTVRRGDQPIALAPREYAVLELLARNRGRVLSRDQLLERVWGYDADPQHKAVDLHVHYLRRKLDPDGEDAAPLIRTVRGAGYVIPAS